MYPSITTSSPSPPSAPSAPSPSSPPSRRPGLLRLLGLGVAAVALTLTPAMPGSAAPTPDRVQDYRVTLTRTPPVMVQIGIGAQNPDLVRQKCPQAFPPGSIFPVVGVPFACTDVPITVADVATTVSGTAQNKANGRSGNFSLICDFAFPASADVTVTLGPDFTPTDVVLDDIDGTGLVGCFWSIKFSGGTPGSLNGTAVGPVSLSRVPGEQLVAASVDLDVAIVSGTSPYDAVAGGTGRYTDTYQAPFEAEPMSTTSTSAVYDKAATYDTSAAYDKAMASSPSLPAAAATGSLKLKLGKKASQAGIVPMPNALTSGDERTLRIAGPAKTKCKAKATHSGSTVSLGKATIAKSGQAVFDDALRSELTTAGSWKIAATCTKSGKKLTTPKESVRIE